jgi:hypothetical protein
MGTDGHRAGILHGGELNPRKTVGDYPIEPCRTNE